MSFVRSLLWCCFGSGDSAEDNERTALLNHDILPESPAQPVGRTSEQQLAQQTALRAILNDASERFVNIEDASPFSRPSPSSSRASSAHSSPSSSPPRHARPTSTWRPTDDGPVRIVHLGEFASPARPASTHSMRTILRHPGKSPLGPSYESEEEGSETGKYGTVGTYRTAREAGSEERDEGAIARGSRLKGGRRALGEIWDHEGDDGKHREELASALKDLEASMDHFTLKPVGPLVEDLNHE